MDKSPNFTIPSLISFVNGDKLFKHYNSPVTIQNVGKSNIPPVVNELMLVKLLAQCLATHVIHFSFYTSFVCLFLNLIKSVPSEFYFMASCFHFLIKKTCPTSEIKKIFSSSISIICNSFSVYLYEGYISET